MRVADSLGSKVLQAVTTAEETCQSAAACPAAPGMLGWGQGSFLVMQLL